MLCRTNGAQVESVAAGEEYFRGSYKATRKSRHQFCPPFCQRHGLTVPRAGYRSYVTGSIRGWSRSNLTYIEGGC